MIPLEGSTQRPDEGANPPGNVPARSKVRSVVRTVPVRAGVTELHLECGHVVRRRLGLCPPTRIICPSC